MTVQTPTTAGVNDTGPLDWRIGIVDKAGHPTPEFQRRWNQQRNNNNLIRTIQTGSGPPTDLTAVQDQVYIDTTSTPYAFYIFENGAWVHVGVVNFTDLGDVPHSYTGFGLSLLRVNTGETGLEFIGTSGALDALGTPAEGDLLYRDSGTWQLLAPGTSGDLLQTNGPGAIPSWVAPTAGSGTVSSVALAAPSIFTVSGSPVTTTGTLTFALNNENANLVFAGPSSGSAAAPTFRALAPADLVVGSGGGTTNFLRADGTWAAPAGGGGGSSVTILSNGTTLTTGVTSIDFTTNMTATAVGTAVTVSASGGGGGGGGLTKISSVTPTGSSFTFSSIPNTFRNLMIMGSFKNTSGSDDALRIQFNGDTANHYYGQRVFSVGSGVTGVNMGNAASGIVADSPGTSSGNFPEIVELVIPNYAGTTFNKVVKGISSYPGGTPTSGPFDTMASVWWDSTAAITSITLLTGAGNFATGSTFDLYGM